MPRRSDDSVRVGLNSIVRARMSSKSGEALGPVDERGDGRRLLSVHARRDVDEHDRPDELGVGVGQRDGGHAAERHADDRLGVRRQRADRRSRRRSALSCDGERAVASAVGVAVAGKVDRDERAAQRQRHRVPRVRVLRAAVQEHELGIGVAPDERAQVPAGLDLDLTPGAPSGGPSYGRPNSSAFSWNIENSSYGTRSTSAMPRTLLFPYELACIAHTGCGSCTPERSGCEREVS